MYFTFNEATCIKCGLCVAECPTALLGMTPEGPVENSGSCIQCGHCVAICPRAAIDHVRTPRSELTPVGDYKILSPEAAEQFMRSRRSTREYLDKPVAREDILRILNMARMAPTGSNTQKVKYLVISDKTKIKAISDAVIAWMESLSHKNAHMRIYYRVCKKFMARGDDYILRNAPGVILAIAPTKMGAQGRDNCHFCLSYAELFAPTLHVGTCWAGFVESWAQSGAEGAVDILSIPEGYSVGGAIMVGYPKVRYRYFTERNPLDVTFLD